MVADTVGVVVRTPGRSRIRRDCGNRPSTDSEIAQDIKISDWRESGVVTTVCPSPPAGATDRETVSELACDRRAG